MTLQSVLAMACATALVTVSLGCTGPTPESGGSAVASDQRRRPDSVRNPLPPGTARVRARVASCSTEAVPPTCRLSVTEVLAYGMSTPTISTPTSIDVRAPRSGETTGASERPVRPGETFTFVLRHERAFNLGEDAGRPSWKIVEAE
jgi:hypothetical protein